MISRNEILDKYKEDEDRIIASKILDKINLSNQKNRIEASSFLNMHQKNIANYILSALKINNYIFYGGHRDAEKIILIIYPKNKEELFLENRYDFNEITSLIRISLPKESTYTHRDYLSGIMKLGIERDSFGDILVFEDGADIIVSKDISKFLLSELPRLTRFSKCKIELLDLSYVRTPELKKEEIKITVTSMRLDLIVADLAHTSRSKAQDLIKGKRVLINYEEESRLDKIVKIGDTIVIHGKGKFEIESEEGKSVKGKTRLVIKHYI